MDHVTRGTECETHVVSANDLEIFYREQGIGPPLLLLHGGTVSSSVWEQAMSLLARHFRVIAPDSRGHGGTNNPAGTLSYRMMAEDMVALITALDLDRICVCGSSDGANVALWIALTCPRPPAALIMTGMSYLLTEDTVQMVHGMLCTDEQGVVHVERFEREQPQLAAYMRADHARVYGANYWRTLLQHTADMWLTPSSITASEFAGIPVPTLVSIGDRDRFVPLEDAVAMYRLIPGAELAVIPNSDHLFPINNPVLFAQSVTEYFLRQSGTGGSTTPF